MIIRSDITVDRTGADTAAGAPVLSIVIVSWNEWPMLERCLTSIYAGELPATEVLVVDNGSADGTPELVASRFPSVELHRSGQNLGASKALNRGFGLARGEFVLKLDADTELYPDCLARLLSFLQLHPDVDLVAGRTFNSDGTVQETARGFPSPLSALFGRRSTLTRWFPNNRISRGYLARQHLDATEPFEVDQVGGAFMLFRRRLLTEIGFLDERYYHYWDDTDWCYRLRAAGKRIFCVPEAKLFHHEGNARGKRKKPKRIWMFHYNAYRFYTRWRTFGYWDPRSIVAAMALSVRALLLMGYHGLLLPRPDRAGPDARPNSLESALSGSGEKP